MKRFTWWRMEQNAPHNARERWCISCSILHHVKRFMSHSPYKIFICSFNDRIFSLNSIFSRLVNLNFPKQKFQKDCQNRPKSPKLFSVILRFAKVLDRNGGCEMQLNKRPQKAVFKPCVSLVISIRCGK